LSKKLANALGGDVTLFESSLGKGSTFVIHIEHGQSNEVFLENTSEPRQANIIDFSRRDRSSDLSFAKILVVDDSPDNLALIKRILMIAGAKVETANDGKEGVAKALDGNYHAVLMDLQMPEMDGFEATKELRRLRYQKPIIALTAHAMKEERKRCLDAGFTDHLTKPIDRDTLIQVLISHSKNFRPNEDGPSRGNSH